ncbi:hypothetical protein FRC01_009732 [Tulasnella sp. 417]|nr:hypothetical protein FRC01_009732 [Tulasnella sp. 417]
MPAQLQQPPPDVVDQAISVLLGSFRSGQDASESNNTAYTAETEIAELDLSATAIHNELRLRAARLKRRQNSSRWIYQLPQEVLAEILMIDVLSLCGEEVEWAEGVDPAFGSRTTIASPAARKAQLCSVSLRFFQTVMTTPGIWSNICWRRDDHIRLLQMSAEAPLTIPCSEQYPTKFRAPGTREEFLRAVWEHSGRWKALSLRLLLDERCSPFLEFSAPQLRDLDITNLQALEGVFDHTRHVFKISGNPALRNLSLTGTSLQWDSVNLFHLKSLSLSMIKQGTPSLQHLTEALRMTSGLEELSLYRVDTINLDKSQQSESQPIHLNALTILTINDLPRGVADHLIRILRLPRLKRSSVYWLLPKHFENPGSDQNPYHHFFRVIIPTFTTRSPITLGLYNEISSRAVLLQPVLFWNTPPNDPGWDTANFGVVAKNPVQAVQSMVEFLKSQRIDHPLTVTVMASGRALGPASSWSHTTSYFPAEVLGKLPTVTRISAAVRADALNILSFLGSVRRDEETGRLGWACTQLEVLALQGVEGLIDGHFQTFLDARYGDGEPLLFEGEIVPRPRRVEFEHHGVIEGVSI